MTERYELAKDRIKEIADEAEGLGTYAPYFCHTSDFIIGLLDIYEDIKANGPIGNKTLEELRKRNEFLYKDITGENYFKSYVNPDKAWETFGEAGKYLAVLGAEVRGIIPYVFEDNLNEIVIRLELFLEVYINVKNAIDDNLEVSLEDLKDIFYYYVFDYTEDESKLRIRLQLSGEKDYATGLLEKCDVTDVRTLYAFGEYVSLNEEKTFAKMAKLSDEQIFLMTRTYTEGFKRGFEVAKKDMSLKTTVNIRFRMGFERIARKAVEEFAAMGLSPIIYRAGYDIFSRNGIYKPGYYGALANPQFDEDHKEDIALVLDGQLVTRRLEGLNAAYEEYKEEAKKWAGPACIEIFGDESFNPTVCSHAVRFEKDKQALIRDFRVKSSEIMNNYIKREERSFAIIAWPTAAIGDNYGEILEEIIKVNTLPVETYEKIQSGIIDVLDKAEYVHVLGMNGNRTDLYVDLYDIKNPETETSFENCLADVNIPLGEVFTSPIMAGTRGCLHVKEVFLNDLKFKNIELKIENGKIADYSCTNYEEESRNREFIEENLLFHYKTLPMGEFAIGTNTYAYRLSKEFGISDKMPILIAEKMGPHFAFGDTCYSNEESVRVFNPNGKEMMAKENGEEYTYCHTDITIPYDELGLLEAVMKDGERVPILKDGRFVLEGCDLLNDALEGL